MSAVAMPARLRLPHLVMAAAAVAAAGAMLRPFGGPGLVEAWLLAVVALSGLSAGALGLLMIGHLMSEDWLAPVRREAEALGLAIAVVAVLALPLAVSLDRLYPWADGDAALPSGRAAYLDPGFFLLRSAFYFATWIVLSFWIVRTRRKRRASAVGLALLGPTIVFAANDWVLSRDPQWWSSLFGFAYGVSQLLAALAFVLLLVLSRRAPDTRRLTSLERALLTLALLALWTWFSQFLIVWLADLPQEAQWYLVRLGSWGWLLGIVALPALFVAIAILVPTGVGRWTMLLGACLVLLHHAGHMVWLVRPGAAADRPWQAVLVVIGLAFVWGAAVAAVLPRLRSRGD
jgi:hypothetical protein